MLRASGRAHSGIGGGASALTDDQVKSIIQTAKSMDSEGDRNGAVVYLRAEHKGHQEVLFQR